MLPISIDHTQRHFQQGNLGVRCGFVIRRCYDKQAALLYDSCSRPWAAVAASRRVQLGNLILDFSFAAVFLQVVMHSVSQTTLRANR